MQHEDREHYIDVILHALETDLHKETKDKIVKNPYEPYNPTVILDLMGRYSIQRRTAKEWLICAQIRLAENLNRKV
jgi:hypothetical protein